MVNFTPHKRKKMRDEFCVSKLYREVFEKRESKDAEK
jgi:hypothetical protein